MSPFYFGSSDLPIFGIYSAANPARDKRKALLICQATFQEYMRSHRLVKQLAVQLSAEGIHVLRFDYPGCGDSSGEWHDTDVDNWTSSVLQAEEELKAVSLVDDISYLGIRFGASLLVKAACPTVNSNSSIIFWDPVFDGEQYFQTLTRMQGELIADKSRFMDNRKNYQSMADLEFAGFPVSRTTAEQMKKIKLGPNDCSAGRILLLHSGTRPDGENSALRSDRMESQALALGCDWESLAHMETQVQEPDLTAKILKFLS